MQSTVRLFVIGSLLFMVPAAGFSPAAALLHAQRTGARCRPIVASPLLQENSKLIDAIQTVREETERQAQETQLFLGITAVGAYAAGVIFGVAGNAASGQVAALRSHQ